MDIFKNLKYDINICTLFDYIELYLACFWTVVPKLLEVKVKELKHLCEDVTDLVYSNSAVLTMFNVKVLSCCIIAAASAIATGFPDRSGALVVWCKFVIYYLQFKEIILTYIEFSIKDLQRRGESHKRRS